MAATAILKIAFFAVTHWPIVRFRRNFVWGSRTACRQRPREKKLHFLKSKIAGGRHFENRYIAISQWKSSDFNKIWYTTSDTEPDYGHVTENWNFWNSRWRRPPSWESLFWPLLISEILHQEVERHADKGCMTKTANFQNPRWRTATNLKIVKLPYLSETIIGFWQNLVYYSMNLMRFLKALSQYLRCDKVTINE